VQIPPRPSTPNPVAHLRATILKDHFNSTLSAIPKRRFNICLFNNLHHKHESQAISHEKENGSLNHRKRPPIRFNISQYSCFFAYGICRENRTPPLQRQPKRRHPRPNPQNNCRTRLHTLPHHQHQKRGDIAHGQNRSNIPNGSRT
jgi:hypothetical protein